MKIGTTAVILLFLCAAGAWGQASAGFGSVTGTVLDAVNNGLPDTTVELSNEALGTARTLNTTDDGVFTAPNVIPGAGYRIKATRKGFASWESPSFAVSTGQRLNFRVTLEVEET